MGMLMPYIVFDNLRYYITCDNSGVIEEGYEGFLIVQEPQEGKDEYLVIYKQIEGDREIQKRYRILPNDLEAFFMLKKKFKNFFAKQETLNSLIEQIRNSRSNEELMEEERLKEICDEIYSLPENYVKFVAMNMTKNQFYNYVKERISKVLN
ncbi:MAG TPA: hypothetical protein PKK61_11245 [Defluviitaleaceae bacterium]|nr:hypothetical protein [Defluviitaleaceae bacterium]